MRPREQSYDINTYNKFKVLNTYKISKEESKRKESYKLLQDYVNSNITKKELAANEPSFTIHFHPPKYEGIKRSYVTKEKPIKFHEKATIANIDAGDINASQKPINFQNLCSIIMKKSHKFIQKNYFLLIQKIGSLKAKTIRIIDYINQFDIRENEKDEVLKSLDDKIDQIKNTEDDIDNIVSNLSSIDKIIYGPEETKVLFKK